MMFEETTMDRKDARGSAKRLGLHRSLCGSAADRDRRPPFRAWSFPRELLPSPRRGALFSVAVEGLALRACTLRFPFSGAVQAAPCADIGEMCYP